MRMKKFDRRREEAQRKFEEDMRAIEELEQKELRKKIDPIVAKMAAVAKEETLRILEANPDVLDEISFKKRDAAKFMKEMLEAYFAMDEQTEATGASAGTAQEPKATSSDVEAEVFAMSSDGGSNALDEFEDEASEAEEDASPRPQFPLQNA